MKLKTGRSELPRVVPTVSGVRIRPATRWRRGGDIKMSLWRTLSRGARLGRAGCSALRYRNLSLRQSNLGHVALLPGGIFVVHIDSYTPDDTANAIALAGHDGGRQCDPRCAGTSRCRVHQVGCQGYRVAFARRLVEPEGVRIILIVRNEVGLRRANQYERNRCSTTRRG